ncbi:MAG: type II toxin-antitoxin system prevent-host-death family antitoxin [Xanthomonadales bacterium]
MTSVALTYAKAHFSELAARAAQGEEIIVTRHDLPLVKLVSASRPSQAELRELLVEMDSIRKGTRLGNDLSIADLRAKGRR